MYLEVYPFDLKLARKITEGSVKGKITDRDGYEAKIIYWNAKGKKPIVALIDYGSYQDAWCYQEDGHFHDSDTQVEDDLVIRMTEDGYLKYFENERLQNKEKESKAEDCK